MPGKKRIQNPWEKLSSYQNTGVIDMREVNDLANKRWPKINSGDAPPQAYEPLEIDIRASSFDPLRDVQIDRNGEIFPNGVMTQQEADYLKSKMDEDSRPLSEKLMDLGGGLGDVLKRLRTQGQ